MTENCPTPEKHQPETMPAGVALFDHDGVTCSTFTWSTARRCHRSSKPAGSITIASSTTTATEPHRRNRARRGRGCRLRDGRGRGRLRQHRMARPVPGQRQRQSAVSQQWRRDLYGCHREGRSRAAPCITAARCGPSRPAGSTTTTTACWICSSSITASGIRVTSPLYGSQRPRILPSQIASVHCPTLYPQQRRRDVHGCFRRRPVSQRTGQGHGRRLCRL